MNKYCGEVKSTNMTLTLADRSHIFPHGIMNNVLVKAGNFIYLVEFEVLDIEKETQVLIILDSSLLQTMRANIDLKTCELLWKFRKEMMAIKAYDGLKYYEENHTYHNVKMWQKEKTTQKE